MSTQINNALAVTIGGVATGGAAGTRTFTTTRQLRVFDLTAVTTVAVVAAAAVFTVSNGVNGIFTMTTANPVVIDVLYRAGGGEAGAPATYVVTTCNDANMVVATGGTLVFATDNNAAQMTAMCYPV